MKGQYELNPKTVYKYVQLKNITFNKIHVRPRKFIEKSRNSNERGKIPIKKQWFGLPTYFDISMIF